eukprot:gnl/MRDRNA2_/MRDRNA2_288260_c0_seq1.p1 gnl/MRDRNA2_/MRDRNA2_288260_c0~~gnl/MRDRNA2_/MRDRNA2_288260_c0_seq1.p1  ORF type:complete len:443 (-),score=71.65 gnl/MRDRNA2_/MRDRNA2_288260_c0_seq1:304-1560(-)
MELFLRIFVLRLDFFVGREFKWNNFDFMVVLSSGLEILLKYLMELEFSGLMVLRVLRTLRLVRTVRALRVLQFFRELRLVIFGIMNSVSSLVWLVVLLLCFMFMVGSYITQVVTEVLAMQPEKDGVDDELRSKLEELYSRLPVTFYSLYKAISAGQSWGELAEPLFQLSTPLGFIFIAYVSFAVFAVLNVVTGVFVDNAHRASENDYEHSLMDETSERHKQILAVQKMFYEADKDGSGEVTMDEFIDLFEKPSIQSYFRMQGIDCTAVDPKKLFQLIDYDGGGNVDIDEFVVGCTKLKGKASSIDVAILQHQVKKQDRKMHSLHVLLQKTDLFLHQAMADLSHSLKATRSRHNSISTEPASVEAPSQRASSKDEASTPDVTALAASMSNSEDDVPTFIPKSLPRPQRFGKETFLAKRL